MPSDSKGADTAPSAPHHPEHSLDSARYHALPYPWGTHSETPSECLNLRIIPNPIYAMFCPIHASLGLSLIYKLGTVGDEQ